MPGFWIWHGSEYARVTQALCRNMAMSEKDVNMPEYVWIYDDRQASEYVSYNT